MCADILSQCLYWCQQIRFFKKFEIFFFEEQSPVDSCYQLLLFALHCVWMPHPLWEQTSPLAMSNHERKAEESNAKVQVVSWWQRASAMAEVGPGYCSSCSLTIPCHSDLPLIKAFPQTCTSLPASFVRVLTIHLDICVHESLAKVKSKEEWPFWWPFSFSPAFTASSFPSLHVFVHGSCDSLQSEQFHILPVSPCSSHQCLKDKILLSHDLEYYQLVDKDAQSSLWTIPLVY